MENLNNIKDFSSVSPDNKNYQERTLLTEKDLVYAAIEKATKDQLEDYLEEIEQRKLLLKVRDHKINKLNDELEKERIKMRKVLKGEKASIIKKMEESESEEDEEPKPQKRKYTPKKKK